MKTVFAALVVSSALALAPLAAQETGRQESGQRVDLKKSGKVCAAGPAQLKGVKGAVLLSRGGSFAQATEGMRLMLGDHIIARRGFADIVMGGAVVSQVSEGMMVTIDEKDGSVCVARVSANPSAIGQADGAGALDTQALLAAGGALGMMGAGLGVGISSVNSGNNASNNDVPPTLSP